MSEHKVAIITGASRGIGRAISIQFAENGYQTVLTGRNTKKLEETAKLIIKAGGLTPKVIPAELRQSHDLSRLVGSTIENFKRIDVLINNAGVLYFKPFMEMTSDELKEMMETNFNAVFNLTQRVAKTMIAQQSGTIVNIASLAGKNGFAGGTGYAASKFALRGFSQSLMLELREHNIRVISVFPGSVNTEMISGVSIAASAANALDPQDVSDAVYAAVSSNSRATMSEIDIRPSNPNSSKK